MSNKLTRDGEVVPLTEEEQASFDAEAEEWRQTTFLDHRPYRPSVGQDVGVTFQRAADANTTVTLDVNGSPTDIALDGEGVGAFVFTPDQEGQVVVAAPDGTSVTVEVQA